MTLNSTDATYIGGEFRSSFAAGQEPKKRRNKTALHEMGS